jgi:hypothetical protein
MPIATQSLDHRGINALICEKIHELVPLVGYTTSARKASAANASAALTASFVSLGWASWM